MLANAFSLIRTDLGWASSETSPGVYNFTDIDAHLKVCKDHGLRFHAVFDYTNHNYDQDLYPYSDKGREAFAAWATAVVGHSRCVCVCACVCVCVCVCTRPLILHTVDPT
jgi:GH35 family endo-1,4-beta-xylanase